MTAFLAYIDPGTTGSLFGLLAPLLTMFAVFLGFVLWPFRKAFGTIFRRDKRADETNETDAPDGPETP